MTRKILFRAKTKVVAGDSYNMGKADGEWVKGYVYDDVGICKIRQFETRYADYVSYEVDPDTVCQFTGLTDKNGKKIFEGDVIHITDRSTDVTSPVVFEDGAFTLDNKNNFTALIHLYNRGSNIEVIGNIYDNA